MQLILKYTTYIELATYIDIFNIFIPRKG